MDFVYFVGRMHVLVLHLPIGVILLALITDWIGSESRFAGAKSIGTLLWGVAAVTAVLSVATGLMHGSEGGFAEPTLDSHRFYAILTMAGCIVVWVLRLRGGPTVVGVAKAAGVVTLVAMLFALYFGSRVTHGDQFLSAAIDLSTPAALVAQGRDSRTASPQSGPRRAPAVQSNPA